MVPEVSNSPPKFFNFSHWIKMILEQMWHAIYSCHVSFSCFWMSQDVIITHLTLFYPIINNTLHGFDSMQDIYVDESQQKYYIQ